MGLIEIEGMEFYAYHGHYKEEQVVGNKFVVHLSIKTNLSKAAESDCLNDVLNYQTAYDIVNNEMRGVSCLLENIAGRILSALYKSFGKQIEEARVKVSKLNPSMGGKIDRVSITMTR